MRNMALEYVITLQPYHIGVIFRFKKTINLRTRVARLFPNEASLLRLVSAIEMEISEDWIVGKRYLNMQTEMENENEFANSKEKRIYRKNVA